MSTTIHHPGTPYLFDRLLTYSRKFWPETLHYLDQAHLFFMGDLPGKHEQIDAAELLQWGKHHFALPFQCVAIEDYTSCLMMFDLAPMATGFDTPRVFIDCISIDDRIGDAFIQDVAGVNELRTFLTRDMKMTRDQVRKVCRVNVGMIVRLHAEPGQPLTFDGMLNSTFLMHPETGRIDLTGDVHPSEAQEITFGKDGKPMLRQRGITEKIVHNDDGSVQIVTQEDLWREKTSDAMRNVIAAMTGLLSLNVPSRFVVERTSEPVKISRKHRRRDSAEPSNPRTRYLFLTPAEIRTKFGLSTMAKLPASGTVRRMRSYPIEPDQWPAFTAPALTPAVCLSDMERPRTVGRVRYLVRPDL